MSFSILEALSIGKPMILSNIEPNLETAKNAAIYVNPYSIYEIKNAINILRSKEIRRTLSKNAKIISSESFNKEISLEGYYNEI